MTKALFRRLERAVAWVIYYTGLLSLLLAVERRFARKHLLVVLTFHRLRSPGDNSRDWISQLNRGSSVSTFEATLRGFSRWFRPASTSQLNSLFDKSRSPDCDSFLVTFDDGYLDTFELATPLIESLSAEGIVFIPTAFIDSETRFWWHDLDEFIRQVDQAAWQDVCQSEIFPNAVGQEFLAESIFDLDSRRAVRRKVAAYLASIPNDEIYTALSRMRSLTGISLECDPTTMNWRQVKQIGERSFAVGGHTHHHAILTRISDDDVVDELATCHRILTFQLGESPLAFAYPAGQFNDKIVSALRDSEFRLAFTTKPGAIVELKNQDRYQIPRIGFESENAVEIAWFIFCLKMCKYLPFVFTKRVASILGRGQFKI